MESETMSKVGATPFLGRLLVATDGMEDGRRAVTFAIALARRHGSTVVLCYSVDRIAALGEAYVGYGGDGGSVLPLIRALDDSARTVLAEALHRVKAAGIDASAEELQGSPAEAILHREKDRAFDALVIGTRGECGLQRVLNGSTSAMVLRYNEIPTFVVPPAAGEADPTFARMLVAVEDSDPSDAAVAFALDFAAADQAALTFCGVAQTDDLLDRAATFGYDPAPLLEEIRSAARAPLDAAGTLAESRHVACENVLVEGDPANAILRAAADRGAGCIVMGTHGRRGVRRWIFGSVAESVARRSPVPVAVVRRLARA
jgi:nucleotide-binding universal stress UspA family protein